MDDTALGNEVPVPVTLYRSETSAADFYEAAWGRVFNARHDAARQPHAVVRASSVAHVREAVALAGRENRRVSVRSGGHSWAAWSVRDGAVLVDLGGLRGIEYDEATAVVRCSPSTVGRDLNAFLHDKSRMFAGGHCPDVGLGGFLLQGGMGWNCKNWGWSCESMVGVDVVTADARELHCSATENSDLFWAARGAGPGFPAIVTRFHLKTRPLTKMFNCIYVYPVSEYRKVLQWVVEVSPTADPDTEIVCVARTPPGSDAIQIVAGFTSFKGSQAEAERDLAPIHDSATRPGNAVVELFRAPTSLAGEYAQQAAANPAGHRYCSENVYVANGADVAGALEPAFTGLPTAQSFALYFAMRPTSRRPLPDMALSLQSDHYFAVYAIWQDAGDDARCQAWARDVAHAVEPRGVGSYLGDADFQHRQTKFWSDASAARLREVRRAWDPTGRICGYLDAGDRSGVEGLRNEFEYMGSS